MSYIEFLNVKPASGTSQKSGKEWHALRVDGFFVDGDSRAIFENLVFPDREGNLPILQSGKRYEPVYGLGVNRVKNLEARIVGYKEIK